MRRIAATLLTAVAILALIGCSNERETKSVDLSRKASEISLSSTGFQILGAKGEPSFAFEWADESEPAISALTEAFGQEPTVTSSVGSGSHLAAYDIYTWSGFVFRVANLEEPKPDFYLLTHVTFTAESALGVRLVAPLGLSVGDPIAVAIDNTGDTLTLQDTGPYTVVLVDAEDRLRLAAYASHLETGEEPARLDDEPWSTRTVAMRSTDGSKIDVIAAPRWSYLPIGTFDFW
ncbi:hypothetical protein [Agromyces sp. SYSU T00194]|uniref:hypothetical protein n=1 Tax=Agromyces chitinivorans TaxID=3158560 RepID=UPI003398E521